MANKLKVHEQEAITNLSRLGWGIRKIARELRISRNTVRAYLRNLESSQTEAIVQAVLEQATDPARAEGTQTDPLSTPGSATGQSQTDPLSTSGNNGRKSLCAEHAGLVTTKVEAGLWVPTRAQRS
jgi:lambda repressor-like predicted transcriptional regulator